jgi:hypothetical protein
MRSKRYGRSKSEVSLNAYTSVADARNGIGTFSASTTKSASIRALCAAGHSKSTKRAYRYADDRLCRPAALPLLVCCLWAKRSIPRFPSCLGKRKSAEGRGPDRPRSGRLHITHFQKQFQCLPPPFGVGAGLELRHNLDGAAHITISALRCTPIACAPVASVSENPVLALVQSPRDLALGPIREQRILRISCRASQRDERHKTECPQ